MDFGTGREQREGSEAVLAGTPLYLAPEVLTGAMQPTVQSDIYSVGVLLYFLLAGSYPVTGGDLRGPASGARAGRTPFVERRCVPTCRVGSAASSSAPSTPIPARRYPSAAALALRSAASVGAPWNGGVVRGAAAALVLAALIVSRPSAPARGVDRPQIAVLPLANVTTDANDAVLRRWPHR